MQIKLKEAQTLYVRTDTKKIVDNADDDDDDEDDEMMII